MQAIASRRAALLAVAVMAALLMGGCGGQAAKSTATPKPAASTTAMPTAAGQTVRGTGYSIRLPAGWSDITAEQRKTSSEKFDLALAGPETQGATANLIVVVHSSLEFTLTDWLAEGREGIVQRFSGRLVGPVERLSLAGTPAMALEYTYKPAGPLHGRFVACLRSGTIYLVYFAAHPQAFATDRAAFDQILASWSWS